MGQFSERESALARAPAFPAKFFGPPDLAEPECGAPPDPDEAPPGLEATLDRLLHRRFHEPNLSARLRPPSEQP